MHRHLEYSATSNQVLLTRNVVVETAIIESAVQATNQLFEELHRVSPHVSALLGMRNLSAFVGAAFITELASFSKGLLIQNPHQDGYPDLLQMDEMGKRIWSAVTAEQSRDKAPFSPFPGGGLEVKATCGSVPTGAVLSRRGLQKPTIGDTRIEMITGIDWKAHHRETNYLMGLVWDFIFGLPAIAAVTYRNDLTETDWGKIISPKEGGGRTTSVSIMTRSGVSKMCSNTILMIDGPYTDLINRFANGNRKEK